MVLLIDGMNISVRGDNMRLIDADALLNDPANISSNEFGDNVVYVEDINKAPTVERPHGTWVDVPKYKGFYVCSKCLERLDGDFERFDHWEMKKDNFCSVCGSYNRKLGDHDDQL